MPARSLVVALPRLVAATLACLAALSPGEARASLVWSPDGRWLACTERESEPAVAPGWIFTPPERVDAKPPAAVAAPTPGAPRRWRIWIVSAEGRDARLAVDSDRPVDALAWHPWEASLAYIRLGDVTAAGEAWRVVIHAGPDRPERVLHEERVPVGKTPRTPSVFGLAWRPDGSSLAAVLGASLVVLDARTGEVHARRAFGATPAWSPTGDRLAFQQPSGGREWTLAIGDPAFKNVETRRGNPRRLPPPIWEDDGDLWRLTLPADAPDGEPTAAAIVRIPAVPVVDESPFPVADEVFRLSFLDRPPDPFLGGPPARPPATLEGVWLATAGRMRLYLLARLTARPTQLLEIDLANPERPRDRAPIDPALRIGELALSPDGRRLATRAGRPDEGCPLIHDLVERRTTFLAASPNLRLHALVALAEAIEAASPRAAPGALDEPFVGRLARPANDPPVESARVARPTARARIAPAPGDSRENPRSPAFRRLALLEAAAPLLADDFSLAGDSPTETPRRDAATSLANPDAVDRALDELRLFFASADARPAASEAWDAAWRRLVAAPRDAEEHVRWLTFDAARLRALGRLDAALVRLDEAEDALDASGDRGAIPADAEKRLRRAIDFVRYGKVSEESPEPFPR